LVVILGLVPRIYARIRFFAYFQARQILGTSPRMTAWLDAAPELRVR